jgi:hypothetical protein
VEELTKAVTPAQRYTWKHVFHTETYEKASKLGAKLKEKHPDHKIKIRRRPKGFDVFKGLPKEH